MEQWKAVEGYEDLYEVSTEGRVKNVKTGHILSPIVRDGYCYVGLYYDKYKQKHCAVHRLVATAFIPNPDNLPEVDHINRDKTDNRVENLRWVSKQQNMDNGGRRVKCVETGKIYETIKLASVETGCDMGNITRVCQGERKTCGGFHWEYVE